MLQVLANYIIHLLKLHNKIYIYINNTYIYIYIPGTAVGGQASG